MSEHPNFIDVVRMLRKERDLGFNEAKDQAIAMFEKRGWPHPFQPKEPPPSTPLTA